MNTSPHYMHMTSASVATITYTSLHYMNEYMMNTRAAPITYTTKVLAVNHTHKHLNISQKNQL
jgi:hypothetical protein